jgi:hypothetical protein
MVALKLGEEGFTKSHAESIYYLIYGFIFIQNSLDSSLGDQNCIVKFVENVVRIRIRILYKISFGSLSFEGISEITE